MQSKWSPSSHLDCFVWYLAVYFSHLAVWYIPVIVCSLVVVKECGVPAFNNHIVQRNLCCYQSFVLLSEVRIVETWDLPPATEVTQCKVGEGQTRTTSSKMHNFYTHYHLHNCLYGNCGNCANWNFQANKILFRGCEVSHYDSGVDNDEKEGDRRTKQDV